MKRLSVLSGFSVLIFLLSSCASTVEMRKAPPTTKFVEATISKGLHKGLIATPVDPTDTFSPEDSEVIAIVKLENLSGKHKIKWEWYDPNGKLYHSTGNHLLEATEGKYQRIVTTWHKLSIRGEKVSHYPGAWQVKIFFDDPLTPVASKNFWIEGEADLMEVVRSALPVPANKNRWALIIGIENYKETRTPALFAERDAKLMKEYFKRFYGIPDGNIFTLINQDATLGTIRDYLENKLQFLTPNDTFYFYYSGHGSTKNIHVDRPYEGVPYILPYDGNPLHPDLTGYSLDNLYNSLGKMNARNIYVFLDACFSGNTTGRYREEPQPLVIGMKDVGLIVKDPLLLSRKIVSFSSSQWNQISNSQYKQRYGLFTVWLVKALADKESPIKREGKITVEKLYEYVKENVSNEANQLYKDLSRRQDPTIQPFPLGERKDLIIWNK